MSLPERSTPHSTMKVPALVSMVWPSLPGHATEEVATGPVEVVVAPALAVEDAVVAEPDDAATEEDAAAVEVEAPDPELRLPPQTPLLVLGAPRPLFR